MSKVRTSRPQRMYLNAEEAVKNAKGRLEEAERRYLIQKGIVNPDGSVPERIFQIEDEETFNTICETFEDVPAHRELSNDLHEAKLLLKYAEENLLYYALKVVPLPAELRKALSELAEKNYNARMSILDLVLQLDVSTVPK